MGNSPSVGLGGGSAHSSRDVRIVNPEKEVDRPIASRAPTHNEYTELPASLKPHNSSCLEKVSGGVNESKNISENSEKIIAIIIIIVVFLKSQTLMSSDS